MGNSLTSADKRVIKAAFNDRGYVLEFTDATFAEFTLDVVGVSIQEKYGFSKGASLEAFFSDCNDVDAANLLNALIGQAENDALIYEKPISENKQELFVKCKEIASRITSTSCFDYQQKELEASAFNSAYINRQIELMYGSVDSNPTEAIGKAKEIIESCAKTILEQRGISIAKSTDYSELVSMVLKELKINRDSVPKDKKASETIKKILSNTAAIANGINELRGSYGSGHGKANNYSGLTPRHAKLAVGSAATFVIFVWDTYMHINSEMN